MSQPNIASSGPRRFPVPAAKLVTRKLSILNRPYRLYGLRRVPNALRMKLEGPHPP